MSACFLAQFASDPECDYSPRGVPDPAHFIPQQRLKKAGLTEEQIWDRRCYEMACRKHHHQFDNGKIRLAYSDYPWPLRTYALDHGFFFVEGRGWRAEARATSGVGFPE
jgi:hypothetical protein